MVNKVGNTRLQNMARLQMIILLLISTSVNCCDEKSCRYGNAIASTAGSTIAAAGGISCAITFGFGCLIAAAGTVVAAGTTIGSEFCDECSESESVPLEKLDQYMNAQKESLQKLSQSQIHNRLQPLSWFRELSSTQKTLVTGQMVSKLNQQKILKDLTTLVSKSEQIQKSIDTSQIIGLYGESIRNLLSLRSHFNDMHKDGLGGIIDDFYSDNFVKATNHFQYGSKRNMRDVIKMLTFGHLFKSQSLWEIDQSYCRKTKVEFFTSLLYSSMMLRRIALAMEGKSMSQREAERFENDVKEVKRSYDIHCFCVDAVNEDSSSRCVRLGNNVDLYGYKYYKVRTQGRMTSKNVKQTCTDLWMVTTFMMMLNQLSKKICQTKDARKCHQLDSVFNYQWKLTTNGLRARGAVSGNWKSGKDYQNKWSLCMTGKDRKISCVLQGVLNNNEKCKNMIFD